MARRDSQLHFGEFCSCRNVEEAATNADASNPWNRQQTLDLASRYHGEIIQRFIELDRYLRSAAPLQLQEERFRIRGQTELNCSIVGEDFGNFERTLKAYIAAYGCDQISWTALYGKGDHSPAFRLLPEKGGAPYTASQLLAVLRALRFNQYFKSISFKDVDFSTLWGLPDDEYRNKGDNVVQVSLHGKSDSSRRAKEGRWTDD